MRIYKYILSAILFVIINDSVSQTTDVFTADGTFTVPCGVTSIQIECWGSGGGGGGGINTSGTPGGGGGGGAYAKVNSFAVVAGEQYTIDIGVIGVGSSSGNGTAGGNTTFNSTTCVAAGGSGGSSDPSGAGGAGGLASASTGDVTYDGGDGSSYVGTSGGGGGGSAGSAVNGNDATTATGATAVADGGPGGNGGASGANGSTPATTWGGGGGGGGLRSGGSETGGNGRAGRVEITYTVGSYNDDCADATTLTIDAAATNGTTYCGTKEASEPEPCEATSSNVDRTVWYKFVATSTEHTVIINTGATVENSWFYSAIYSGSCGSMTQIACERYNETANSDVKHHLNGLTIGNTYHVQLTDESADTPEEFTIQVITGADRHSSACSSLNMAWVVDQGTCFTDDLSDAVACLNPGGCAVGTGGVQYAIVLQNTSLHFAFDNETQSFDGDIEVVVYHDDNGDGLWTTQGSSCGAWPLTASFTGLTAGRRYMFEVTSSLSETDACTTFGINIGDGSAVTVGAGCGQATTADAYGIYSTEALSNTSFVDCEITGSDGCSGTTYLVYDNGGDNSYTETLISNYPVVSVTGISCANSAVTAKVTDPSPSWTSTGTAAITYYDASEDSAAEVTAGVGTYDLFKYDAGQTGYQTITLDGEILQTSETFSSTVSTAINDLSCVSITDVINVSGYTGTVATANISVTINMTHTGVIDLIMWLTAPNGDILNLAYGEGSSSGDNFTNTVFTDNAATNITAAVAGDAPYTGSWQPEGTLSAACGVTGTVATFGAIAGGSLDPDGNWTLTVIDPDWGAPVNTTGSGTFDDWSITFPTYYGTGTATYTDFLNLTMDKPGSGSINGVAEACSDISNDFSSSEAGTPGYEYLWSTSNPAGVSATIATTTGSSTGIAFSNTTTGDLVSTVTLNITSGCCGPLDAVNTTVTIHPLPGVVTVDAAAPTNCEGGSYTMNVTPTTANTTYVWYDASSGGNILGTGTSYEETSTPNGTTNYYVEATSDDGCVNPNRTLVALTSSDTPPTGNDVSYCSNGTFTLQVNDIDNTTFKWYDASSGGSQLGTGTTYDFNVTCTPGCTQSVWVSATTGDCAESSRDQVDVVLIVPTPPTTWDGSTDNDWFDQNNWSSCVPECGLDAVIPDVANDPNISFTGTVATVQSVTVESGAVLTFSDTKSRLEVCGDLTHQGTITMASKGTIAFASSDASQTFTKTATATGDYYTVEIDNTHTTPTIDIADQDMVIASDGYLNLVNGVITTDASEYVIVQNTSGSAVSYSGTSWVNGNLRRYVATNTDLYGFPVGDGNTASDYHLIEMTNDNLTGGGFTYLDGKFGALANHSDGDMSVWEYVVQLEYTSLCSDGVWFLDADNQPSGGTYDIKAYFGNFGCALTDNQFGVLKRSSGSTTAADWACTPCGQGDPGYNADGGDGRMVADGYVIRYGFSGFSQFGIGTAPTVLPLDLISYKASCDNENVKLTWTTASEVNTDYFVVSRSIDGGQYVDLPKVEASNKSNGEVHYELYDNYGGKGTAFYKLSLINMDGKKEELGMVSTTSCYDNYINVNILNTEKVQLTINTTTSKVFDIEVYDITGKIIMVERQEFTPGFHTHIINSDKTFAKGLYFVQIKDDTKNILNEKVYISGL